VGGVLLFLINLIYFFFFVGLPDEKHDRTFEIEVRGPRENLVIFFLINLTSLFIFLFCRVAGQKTRPGFEIKVREDRKGLL
jgi:hypothetical protein